MPTGDQAKEARPPEMKILFLHGWNSVPGGVKPTFLASHGHEVVNPALPHEDFAGAVEIAQAEFERHGPQGVVGSSRGGAVAMNIESGDARLVLLWRFTGRHSVEGPPFNFVRFFWRQFGHMPWLNRASVRAAT